MRFLRLKSAVKRLFDLSLSYLGMFFSLPLWVIFCYGIFLEDGWPIFYPQTRVGKGGLVFRAIKFRTLGYRIEKPFLSRLLRATALDELPQLINIIRGQMSFVGPRPLIPEEIQMYVELAFRSTVRPGLTGMAQVYAPKDAPVTEKFKYDLWYIQNQNLGLDIYLILMSFWISMKKKWDVSVKKYSFRNLV